MILDLFAGPGGWDEGLRLLGYTGPVLGVETDADAVATRTAAGHATTHRDVRSLSTADVVALAGLIASPPCQSFSAAGKGEGKAALGQLIRAARLVLRPPTKLGAFSTTAAATIAGLDTHDPRSTLVLEPLRFIRDHLPAWFAFEEVPTVLPVWKAYAHLLSALGYSTWAGILNSADYGVPQARRRAFLLGTLNCPVPMPVPTHSSSTVVGLFGDRKPWVTMAEALDLGPEPDDLTRWAWHRPATTIVRSFRPEIVAAPAYRTIGDPSRQNAPGSIECTPEQLCILQGIRPDYPFQGSDSKRLSLIGAILPPTWAAAILKPLITTTTGEAA